MWFEFSKWRWSSGEWKRYLIWLVLPLVLLAGWRLLSQKQWHRARRNPAAIGAPVPRMGLDSEFYLVERALAASAGERRPGETLSGWVCRNMAAGVLGAGELPALLAWHYRLRFDPVGLGPQERAALKVAVESWLARYQGH